MPRDPLFSEPKTRILIDNEGKGKPKDKKENTEKAYKPKTPPKIKIDKIVDSLAVKDGIIPILSHTLNRYLAKKEFESAFERKMFHFLKGLPEKNIEAMKSAFSICKDLPDDTRNSLFEEKFFKTSVDTPIDEKRIAHQWLTEAIALGGKKLFPRTKDGVIGPGKARLWKREFSGAGMGGEEFGTEDRTAPWPWICRVSKDLDKWYRNTDFKPELNDIQPHEYDQVCHYDPDAETNYENMIETCQIRMAQQVGLHKLCKGEFRYTDGDTCLKIMEASPGETIHISGFNFFSKDCKIRLTNKADSSVVYPDFTVPVWPDMETEDSIADCRVHDSICFDVPTKHLDGFSPVEPGLYEVKVIVPNEDNHTILAYQGKILQTDEFESNSILLEILPDPDIEYHIHNNWGMAHKETGLGAGGDQIWWDAFTATFDPGSQPNIPLLKHVKCPRAPWEDMDSGEGTDPIYHFDIFSGKASPGVAIAIVGYEVDSEEVAREQLKDFSDAFCKFITEAWEALVGALGLVGGAMFAEFGLGWGIAAILVVAAIGLVIGVVYGLTAPADLIGIDSIALSASELFSLTNPKTPIPGNSFKYIQGIQRSITPTHKKKPSENAAFAVYTESRRYDAPDEDSRYELVFHYERK